MKFRKFTMLGDKGYFNGKCLYKVKRMQVIAIVSSQNPSPPKGQPKEFHADKFTYDETKDSYTCPAGNTLPCRSKKTTIRQKYYDKQSCAKCPHNQQCNPVKEGQSSNIRYRVLSRDN
jgi:hypothetical protein